MIRINQIKLPVTHDTVQLEQKIKKALKLKADTPFQYQIVKKSIDARKKPDLFYVYSVDVETADDQKILKKVNNNNVMSIKVKKYLLPEVINPSRTPVIAGAGPAGLFCAYALMSEGFHPIVAERGKKVEERTADVQKFWETGVLDTASNVQFGEGGAGTFSDGKLNTLVKDPIGRNRFVLETFVKFGAPEHILYENKPHIGTDILADVIKRMREFMTENGVEFLFETCVTGFSTGKNGNLKSIELNHDRQIDTDCLILAIGHSARDTFSLLQEKGLNMQAKSFAVGFRVEHPQSEVNLTQYGDLYADKLPAAPYKVTANLPSGRGVYSFCMCPGGYVVNASSEEHRLAVNGMSYSDRGKNRPSVSYGAVESTTKGDSALCNLRGLLPEELEESFIEGMHHFSRAIPEFDREDAILSGVESRTSSPVRIVRDESFQSNIRGIYPCGEGAGYAGGIMSAAMDGLKVAEAIGRYAIKSK